MNRKKINPYLYIAAISITLLIFLLGYVIGSGLNELKLQEVYDLEHEIRVDSLGNELAYEMITSDICNYVNISSYTEEIAEIGKKLTYMENIYGHEDPQVINLKSYYSLLLVRHFLIHQQMEAKCDIPEQQLIYFYTNYEGCADCEDQGKVLTNVHRESPVFNIYSFEYREDNAAITLLKQKYNIQQHKLPAIVINETPYYGFQSKEKIENLLNITS